MALKDVIGHEKPVKILLRTIQRDRIPTTYLFAGESGTGKKFTAFNFAKAVNCQSRELTAKGEEGGIDACDDCVSCRKIDAGVHPDFFVIMPENGQIRIEEIRQVNEKLCLKPFEGKKKILIVDDADAMNQHAANAFLKTLEEPPEDSLILLVSSNPDRLPDTIRSRCSRINFALLPREACEKVIQKFMQSDRIIKLQHQPIAVLAKLSMGRPGLIISRDPVEERDWFIKLLKNMLDAGRDGWVSKDEMAKWFDQILLLLRDMAVLKVMRDEKKLINSDIHDYVNKLSGAMDLRIIIESYHRLNGLKGYLDFNVNKSLIWNYTGSLLRKEVGMYA
ncbi:MAG: DNA polymerase III subunit delta' [Nitrospirota bacterium]